MDYLTQIVQWLIPQATRDTILAGFWIAWGVIMAALVLKLVIAPFSYYQTRNGKTRHHSWGPLYPPRW